MDSSSSLSSPPNPDSPSPSTRPSSRHSSRRTTARRSLLGLFVHLASEDSIPEDLENTDVRRRTIVDPLPPRLASLDLPRLDVDLQSQRSPTSVRSVIDPGVNPGASTRPSSTASARSVQSRRSQGSQRSQRSPGSERSQRSFQLPIQVPARSLDYGGNVSTNPATERQAVDELPFRHPADSLPDRHPADPLPQRHPADPLPSRAMSESTEASGDSGHLLRRKRRKRARRQQRMPRNRLIRRFFPALRYSSVRRKVLHCSVTGTLMLLVFIIFLALMNATNDFAQEFRIITVLFMLIFVVLFAHSLIRLIVLLLRLRRNGGLADPDDTDPDSYAQVNEPIPVVLARDEELGLSGSQEPESNKHVAPPPPAYGRWRGSVRVDPNLIHWERANPGERPLSEGTIRRPPSYAVEEEASESQEAAPGNVDELNEKPIRPRTPPVEPEPARRHPMVLYDATQSWVPRQSLQ